MGKAIYENYPNLRYIFHIASSVLGRSVEKICFEGPEDLFRTHVITQVSIFTVSLVTYLAFMSEAKEQGFIDLRPKATCGLSLGEYMALVASGAICDNKTAIELVYRRAYFMDEIANNLRGAMLAIVGLEPSKVAELCKDYGGEIANLNAPGQVVVAVVEDRLSKLKEAALSSGARKVVKLDVPGVSHCSLLSSASENLANYLKDVDIKKPDIPICTNVTAEYLFEPEKIKEALARQLVSPVRWQSCIENMIKDGIKLFIEVGPSKVLCGLIRRINKEVETFSVQNKEDIFCVLERLK
jgi:[acyl-carrier-protein] S-malonyltransferase